MWKAIRRWARGVGGLFAEDPNVVMRMGDWVLLKTPDPIAPVDGRPFLAAVGMTVEDFRHQRSRYRCRCRDRSRGC